VDGPWSTFEISVGDNGLQKLRCLPGISLDFVILPVPTQDCSTNSSNACGNRTSFSHEDSTSWVKADQNIARRTGLERFWNQTSNKNLTWGADSVYLGYDRVSGMVNTRQIIESTSLDFFVGLFGLSAGGLGAGTNAWLSLPSNSFSYTAGSATSKTTSSISIIPLLLTEHQRGPKAA
jgi:hypothetical protein